MASNSFIKSQPGKLFFTLWVLALNALRLPFWLIYFIPSSLRQSPKWSYRQAVGVRILKAALTWMSDVEMVTPLSLKPGREGANFVNIQPGKPEKYVGVVTKDPEIKPVTIGGTWYPKPPPSSAAAAGNVVVHFHGGAYVIGDGRKQDAGFAAKTLLENTPANYVLCPQYRLASNPGGRFPAFLIDGITSFLYLTETFRIPPEKITISGDSAGGHLCLSLLRYISDYPEINLSEPACALLWSPWVNPAGAAVPGAFASAAHEPTDYLCEGFGMWGARSITPSKATGLTMEHPNLCITPGNAFMTPTALYFSVGECEVLFQDDVDSYEEFKAISGNKVEMEIETAAVHDIILTGRINGFHKEAALGAKKAGKFMEKYVK